MNKNKWGKKSQQAMEIRFKFPWEPVWVLRNTKPYGLFINADFLKDISIKLQNLQFLQVNSHSVDCWLEIFNLEC